MRTEPRMPPLVLIVDDEALIALALQIQVEEAGYRVRVALTLAEVCNAIDQELPSAVILELDLAGGPAPISPWCCSRSVCRSSLLGQLARR
jgi:DNA-binding NtrC family response regulator